MYYVVTTSGVEWSLSANSNILLKNTRDEIVNY